MLGVRYWLILVMACFANNAFAGTYTTCEWVPPGDVTTPTGSGTSPGYWYCMIYSEGSIGQDAPDDYYGGGGVSYYIVDRDPANDEKATCSSDGPGRYLSARQDFLKWKADTRPTQIYGKGEILKVSYLGGGDEKYIWMPGTMASPTAPAEAMLARVVNTLNCP